MSEKQSPKTGIFKIWLFYYCMCLENILFGYINKNEMCLFKSTDHFK